VVLELVAERIGELELGFTLDDKLVLDAGYCVVVEVRTEEVFELTDEEEEDKMVVVPLKVVVTEAEVDIVADSDVEGEELLVNVFGFSGGATLPPGFLNALALSLIRTACPFVNESMHESKE